MANFFPCPNPACTYQFDADQLPAAAMVTCPICRTRFPYRATNPATQEPAAEHHHRTHDDGHEHRSSPTHSAGTTAPPRERVNRLITPRDLPKSNKTQTILMFAGFGFVVITIMVIVMVTSKKKWFEEDESGTDYLDSNFNFRFLKFEKKWREDKTMRKTLPMNGFLMRMDRDNEPAAWIGLWCKDFVDHNPSPRELETQLHALLDKFGRVQKEQTTAKIAQQSVEGAHFKDGSIDGAAMEGEGFAFANKGIGYVLLMWAPQDRWETAKVDLYPLRDSFKYATLRDKWSERGATAAIHIVEGGDYQLDDVDRLWELDSSPKDENEKATMLFHCLHPAKAKARKSDRIYPAHAMVLVFDKGGDTFDEIKKYLLQARNKTSADFTMEAYPSPPFKTSVPSNGGIFRMTSTADRTLKYFYAVNIVNVGGKSVVAVGWCPELESPLMGPYIISFIGSLKSR